ncbi:hypothetical protein BAY60_08335 [Prauserella muralis]|uniref:Uncharacterized protein n=1 Tax=Prauserella muralis TaxID=588067 RepID=A0A2V4BAH7_9PSEU|nr:hypothetical protein BAY60_08335 [Prauserella muralis]
MTPEFLDTFASLVFSRGIEHVFDVRAVFPAATDAGSPRLSWRGRVFVLSVREVVCDAGRGGGFACRPFLVFPVFPGAGAGAGGGGG